MYLYSFFTAGLTRKPLHTQAQPAPYSGHSAATTAYLHTYTSPHICEAKGCYKTAYYDPMLGYFSYCSPKCRDEHLLPDYNKKLEAAIANFEANPPPPSFKKTSFEVVRHIQEIQSREPLGIIFAKKDGTKASTCTLYRHACINLLTANQFVCTYAYTHKHAHTHTHTYTHTHTHTHTMHVHCTFQGHTPY